MKEVVMVFKNHMIGDCFHLWNSEMYRLRDIRRDAVDKWVAVSGWDVQRVFFGWQMAAARDRGKAEAQLAIVENVLRRRQRKLQAVVLDALVAAVAERKGQTEVEKAGDGDDHADSHHADVDDSTLIDARRSIAEVRAHRLRDGPVRWCFTAQSLRPTCVRSPGCNAHQLRMCCFSPPTRRVTDHTRED